MVAGRLCSRRMLTGKLPRLLGQLTLLVAGGNGALILVVATLLFCEALSLRPLCSGSLMAAMETRALVLVRSLSILVMGVWVLYCSSATTTEQTLFMAYNMQALYCWLGFLGRKPLRPSWQGSQLTYNAVLNTVALLASNHDSKTSIHATWAAPKLERLSKRYTGRLSSFSSHSYYSWKRQALEKVETVNI